MIKRSVQLLRSILFPAVFYLLMSEGLAQTLPSYGGGNYGAGTTLFRDYQAAGINPANLGILENNVATLTFGLFETSGRIHSTALPKSDLIGSIFRGDKLTAEDKIEMAQLFAEEGLTYDYYMMPAGLAFQAPKFGGLSFTWKEKLTGNAILNPAFADLVFKGVNSTYMDSIVYDAFGIAIGLNDSSINFSDYFNGSIFQFSWQREFNFSYGRQLIELDKVKVYGGIGVKFLQGNAITDISYANNSASGFAAFSPIFEIDYSDITQPNVELKGDFSPVGHGFALDFGGTVSFNDRIFAGISVTDLGSMKWTGNLVQLNDGIFDSLINFIGVDAADIYSDIQTLLNADGLFAWSPVSEIKQTLPAELRIGGSIRFTEQVEAGIDFIQPFNKNPGSSQRTTLAGIINFSPVKAIKISSGFIGGGIVDLDIPVGIAFSFTPEQAWQIAVGTGDIISLVKQDKPTVSLSVSLLRFRM